MKFLKFLVPLLLVFCSVSESAIVFQARGNSLTARYSNGGSTGFATSTTLVVANTATTVGIGSVAIDLNTVGSAKGVSWPGQLNTPNGRSLSFNIGYIPQYTGSPSSRRSIFSLGGFGGRLGNLEIDHETNGNLTVTLKNEAGTATLNGATIAAFSPNSGTRYDLSCQVDLSGTTNAFKFYKDSSLIATLSPSAAFFSGWNNHGFQEINIGQGDSGNTALARYDEITIWDTLVDFTGNVTLDSGSALLNGSARSSYITASSLDGLSYTDPGVANVLSTVSYTYAGASQTGTYVVASAANIKTGVTFGPSSGSTGTYDGSDRWTDVGQDNVLNGYAYKANSTSNNKAGTVILPIASTVKVGITFGSSSNQTGTYDGSERYTDVGVANVLSSVGNYKYNSASNNRTPTYVDVGAAGNVKTGVSYGVGLTGTYTGSDRWSDPGQDNVLNGYAYKADSTTNNKSGTVILPIASTVKTGITFGSSSNQTGTYTGSDRWSDPGIANVLSTISYKADSTSNNRTGTYVDVGAQTNVKHGVAYGNSSTGSYRGTDLWTAVSASDLKHDVTATQDGVVTGTYRGADLWTAVSASNLKHDVTAVQDGSVLGTYRGYDLFDILATGKVQNGFSYLSDGSTLTGSLNAVTVSNTMCVMTGTSRNIRATGVVR